MSHRYDRLPLIAMSKYFKSLLSPYGQFIKGDEGVKRAINFGQTYQVIKVI